MKPAHEQILKVRGEWRDVYRDADGNVLHDTGWRPNQIQNTNAHMLAALAKNHAGYGGILYLAIGSGQAAWDTGAPAQPFSDTTLETEFFRKAIPAANITFRDPVTFADQDPTPSNVIQIDVTIDLLEANGTHREFGLFGGDATAALDSGLMSNWVVTSRIDKDASMSIARSIRYTFAVV